MNKKRNVVLLILAVCVAALATVAYLKRDVVGWVAGAFLCGIPSGSEAQESSRIVQFVADNYAFAEKSKSVSDRPPVFCRPGGTGLFRRTPHTVIIYTVTDKREQDKIIELISRYRSEHNLRHIKIQFYREENWRTWTSKDGSRGGSRGKEDLIRTERL